MENKKPPRELDSEEYDNNALSYYEYDLENLSKINLDYEFLRIKDFEKPKTLSVTIDEKTALIGCDDHARVHYINLREKSIETNYLGDEDINCMGVISNSRAIAFTYNGYAALLNLDREEVIKQSQLLSKDVFDDVYIREAKHSLSQNITFAITSKILLAIDNENLSLLGSVKLDFEPFFVLPIPDTNFIAVSGSFNRLELFKFEQLVFTKVDSIPCVEANKNRIASIAFDTKNNLLISSSETDFKDDKKSNLDIWILSKQGLKRKYQLSDIKGSIDYIQCVDEYVAFSTNKSGVFLLNTQDNLLINIYNACDDIILKKINEDYCLLFYVKDNNGFTEENGVYILNLDTKNLYQLEIKLDWPRKALLTSDGTIIMVNDRDIILSNLFETKQTTSEYDFKVDDFVFNQNEQSVLLKCKDKNFRQISLKDNQQVKLELPESVKDSKIDDFADNRILMRDYSEISIWDIFNGTQKSICTKEESSYFEDSKILSNKNCAVITKINHPNTKTLLDIYNLEGEKITSKAINYIDFIDNINILSSGDVVDNKSTITNLKTEEVLSFDIRYIIRKDNVEFSSDLTYCLHLIVNEMFCADLKLGGTRLWHIKAHDYPQLALNVDNSQFFLKSLL